MDAFSVLWGTYVGAELLGHVVTPFKFLRNGPIISRVVALFYLPPNDERGLCATLPWSSVEFVETGRAEINILI